MSEEVKAEGQEEAAAPQLGLNDLAAAIQIIDVCSKRGAFEGAELETVGGVRGRLAAFVQANAPQKEEGEEAEGEAEATDEAADA
jgi:hypothetical protein